MVMVTEWRVLKDNSYSALRGPTGGDFPYDGGMLWMVRFVASRGI